MIKLDKPLISHSLPELNSLLVEYQMAVRNIEKEINSREGNEVAVWGFYDYNTGKLLGYKTLEKAYEASDKASARAPKNSPGSDPEWARYQVFKFYVAKSNLKSDD